MALRLTRPWKPSPQGFLDLLSDPPAAGEQARPYPFVSAISWTGELGGLGDVSGWQVEWEWNGVRAQLVRRDGQVALWSRTQEVLTSLFPEVAEAGSVLPEGTVLDGEVVAWRDGRPLAWAALQERLKPRGKRAADPRARVPVVLLVQDLLEWENVDWRERRWAERRSQLERVVSAARAIWAGRRAEQRSAPVQGELFLQPQEPAESELALRLSPALQAGNWEAIAARRGEARSHGASGILLKRWDSPYGAGLQRGAWLNWKAEPLTCDAVLVAAQPARGRRDSRLAKYTLAVWEGSQLVPVASVTSGLAEAELEEVETFVRQNTTGRFGAMRSVKPALVFELVFEGVARSARRRCGLILERPSLLRWRRDRSAGEADRLERLRVLAEAPAEPGCTGQPDPA
jgi:DNA ligase-1